MTQPLLAQQSFYRVPQRFRRKEPRTVSNSVDFLASGPARCGGVLGLGGGRGATMDAMRQGSPAMVGREAELRDLRQVVTGAASGVPGLAVVTGDAGMGKTRLVEALVAESERTCLVL